ncbi:unnamed protein product [Acidithrix sp. C25]|nr:unnamed protein product [Acidithrix sp. C25]
MRSVSSILVVLVSSSFGKLGPFPIRSALFIFDLSLNPPKLNDYRLKGRH